MQVTPSQSSLLHSTIYEDRSLLSTVLPFIESLQAYHRDAANGFENGFHLVEDPLISKRAVILGMFVLRPAYSQWLSPIIEAKTSNDDQLMPSLPYNIYEEEHEWSFNCRGFEGGWLIANKNSVDAYRLALQYALCDAVLIGTNTISMEGVRTAESPGYIWQPYVLCQWDQLKSADPNLEEKFITQRAAWQQMGYLSSRKYPAQIAFSWSGEHFEGSRDFLEGEIFHAFLPDGQRMEVYIVTSSLGAARIRQRAAKYGLGDRIEQMLIVLPASTATPQAGSEGALTTDMDLSDLPKLLHDRLGMKIINHDGGHKVLREFCKAGIIPQMNLTLCRKLSVRDVVASMPNLDPVKRQAVLETFDQCMQYFFSSRLKPAEEKKSHESDETIEIRRSVPKALRVASILQSAEDEVAVVTFYTKGGFDFFVQ